MRLEHLTLRSLGPFADVSLDLSDCPGPIVAVAGPNGAGKSTLLELFAGALYRECPTRGKLHDLATARDALLEARVVNGAAYTLRHAVDPVSRKGESVALDAQGAPLLDAAQRSEFDRWAKVHMPDPSVFYSTIFAAQRSRSLLDMRPGERKAVLVRALGIERYERMAQAARERARASESDARVARARLADAEAIVREAEGWESNPGAPDETIRGWSIADLLDDARDRATWAEGALSVAREAERVREEWLQLRARKARLRSQLEDLDERRRNNAALLARAEEIRAAVARDAELAEEQSQAAAEVARLEAERAALQREIDQADAAAQRLTRRETAARARLQSADAMLARGDEIREAAAASVELATELERLGLRYRELGVELDAMRDARAGVSEGRIERLRLSLGTIESMAGDEATAVLSDIRREARDTLDADTATAEEDADRPARFTALSHERTRIDGERNVGNRRLGDLRRLAAQAPLLESAERDREAAAAELQACAQERAGLDTAAARERWNGLTDDFNRSEIERFAVSRQRKDLARLTRLAPQLDAAEGRLAELDPQIEAARAELADVAAQLDALVVPEAPPVADAERAAREAHAAVARLERQAEEAAEAAERAEGLRAEVAQHESDGADWTRLARDLGRDGLQALEIDAAGPEISAVANDLLHTCFGSRWTVEVVTTRSSADGKRELETCDILVTDTEAGRIAPVETLSGGESVIVGEALSLALTTVACRRAGVDRPTLIRDESGAALDAGKTRAWIAMLRRAAGQIGADRVLVVSHVPEVRELADSVIEIADGRVEVR